MCLLYSSSNSLRSLSNELRTNSTAALNNNHENDERERIELHNNQRQQHHDHEEYAGVSQEQQQHHQKAVELSTRTVLATAKIKRLITGILFQANDILYSLNHKYTNNSSERNNSNDDDRQQQSNHKHQDSNNTATTPIWFKAIAVFIATILYHSDQAIQSIDRILGLVRDLIIHNFICLVTVLATRYCSRNLCHTIKDYMNMPIAEEDKSSESIGNSSKIKEEERILEQVNNDEEEDCRDEVEMEESSSSSASSSISQEIREAVQESIQESSVEQQQQPPSQQVKSSSFLPGGNFEDETDEWGHFTDFQDTEEMPMTVLSTSTSTSSLSTCCSLDDSTTTLNSTTTSSFNTASTMTTSPFMGDAATSSSMSSNCNVNSSIGIDGSNNYFSLDDPFKSINRAILRMRGDVSVCKMDKLTEEEQDDIDDDE